MHELFFAATTASINEHTFARLDNGMLRRRAQSPRRLSFTTTSFTDDPQRNRSVRVKDCFISDPELMEKESREEKLSKMAVTHTIMRKFAVAVTIGCAAWSLSFIIFGATASGKAWYSKLSAKHFSDAKGGVPVVTLAIPALVAGSVAVLFNVRSERQATNSAMRVSILNRSSVYQRIQRWKDGGGDVNFNRFSFHFIFIPLCVYFICNIHRHFYGNELSYNAKLTEASNAFAFVALIAMSYFLIPVARQSPILNLFHWDPASAVKLHIWSGRIIIVGVIVHGIMHMYRWAHVSGESVVGLLFPPAPCWTLQETDYQPTCADPDTECSCYFHFRNLTGLLGFVGLLVIAATTFNYVRRHHYRIFYMTHVMAAPTVLIMVILHWRRSVLYMAPSLLYYAATSAPILSERAVKSRDVGVKIVSVKYIASRDRHKARPCVSLTVAASDEATLSYEPGQYVKLLAPDISAISHPFTINRVPGKLHELRIIFRATGAFTHQLSHGLTSGSKLPTLRIDGFYGNTNRVDQVLKHDVAVMVAGGIGITPYLTLLREVASSMASHPPQQDGMDTTTKEVVLHWMCRDPDLVKYVKAQYFDSLRWNVPKASFCIRLIVHDTNSHSNTVVSSVDTEQAAQESQIAADTDGASVTPSRFASGTSASMMRNVLSFITVTSIAWVGLWATWELYVKETHDHEIVGRGWAVLAILLIALVISVLANAAARLVDKFQAQTFHHGLIENIEENEVEMATVEEGIAKQPLVGVSDNGKVHASTSLDAVTYQEKAGRPSVHELMKSLDGARCPGLFICGPKQLTQALREAASERCQMRIRHCIRGTPHIAVYEESFQM